MEILAILLKITGILILLAVAAAILMFGAVFVFTLWPIATGITIGVITWHYGHDNIAVIIMIIGIVGQGVWYYKLEKRGF